MELWLKTGLMALAGIVVVILGVLVTLHVIAKARGVREAALWPGSLVWEQTLSADYQDALQIDVPPDRFASLEELLAAAFQKGELLARNEQEALYTDVAPGLRFYVSYSLIREAGRTHVCMSTSVQYLHARGRVYFAFVRPLHRLLVPFALSQMVR